MPTNSISKEEIIKIISTHPEGEGKWCDTGEDMEWGCRSECVSLAIKRLEAYFTEKEK